MLGRLYAIVFAFAVIAGVIYQKKYIDNNSEELNSFLSIDESKFLALSGSVFSIYLYKENTVHQAFYGNKIDYFNDGSFTASAGLRYLEFNSQGEKTLELCSPSGKGFVELEEKGSLLLSSSATLKTLWFPEEVSFHFDNYRGETRDVRVDNVKQVIFSDAPMTLQGEHGNIKALGFLYNKEKESFLLRRDVSGTILP